MNDRSSKSPSGNDRDTFRMSFQNTPALASPGWTRAEMSTSGLSRKTYARPRLSQTFLERERERDTPTSRARRSGFFSCSETDVPDFFFFFLKRFRNKNGAHAAPRRAVAAANCPQRAWCRRLACAFFVSTRLSPERRARWTLRNVCTFFFFFFSLFAHVIFLLSFACAERRRRVGEEPTAACPTTTIFCIHASLSSLEFPVSPIGTIRGVFLNSRASVPRKRRELSIVTHVQPVSSQNSQKSTRIRSSRRRK